MPHILDGAFFLVYEKIALSHIMNKDKLVFAITTDGLFGSLVEPFIVTLTDKGLLSYTFRKIDNKTLKDYNILLNEPEKIILTLINEYHIDELNKKFPSCNLLNKQYNREKLNLVIRPYINNRIDAIVTQIINNKIHLYFKGTRKSPIIEENEVIINTQLSEISFNFEKTDLETHYFITAAYNGVKLILFKKHFNVLCDKPAIVIIDNVLHRFEDDLEANKIVPFFNKEYITIPKHTEKKYFSSFILKTLKNHNIQTSGFDVKIIEENPIPVIKLSQNISNHILLGLYFRYKNILIPADNKDMSFVNLRENDDDFCFEKRLRNYDYEKQIFTLLYAKELDFKDTFITYPSSELYEVIQRITLLNEFLIENKIEFDQSDFSKKYFIGKVMESVKLGIEKDWFDINIITKFGEFEIPFISLRQHIINRNKEFVLPDGRIGIIPDAWFERFRDIALHGNTSKDSTKLEKYHLALIEPLLNENSNNNKSKLLTFYKSFNKSHSNSNLELNALLRNYQKKGFSWLVNLYKNHMGGILADDMGLGKTIQLITFFLYLKKNADNSFSDVSYHKQLQLELFADSLAASSERYATSLVVAPLSLLHNWQSELSKFAPSLKVYKYYGLHRNLSHKILHSHDVVLTTYGSIRNDVEELSTFNFECIVLDESQNIKNPYSKVFLSVKQLKAKQKFVLTGTPVENSLLDIWSQLNFVNPLILGSLNFFKNEYLKPIEKNNEAISTKLKKLIAPFILRRTKEEVAKDLPPLSERIYLCQMTEEQEQFYDKKKSEVRNYILDNISREGIKKSQMVILSGLTKLRLISNHPLLIEKNYNYDSGKFIEIIENIEKLNKTQHKVLIFSQFVKYLKFFKEYFEKNKLPYAMLTGETTERERIKQINIFQKKPEVKFFLISLKAGGQGLNLTAADYVFVLDPWWNPAVEIQAISRSHRIGQNKKVFVYKFICKDSIEEKIVLLQQKKSYISKEFIDNKINFSKLSENDIIELFN